MTMCVNRNHFYIRREDHGKNNQEIMLILAQRNAFYGADTVYISHCSAGGGS